VNHGPGRLPNLAHLHPPDPPGGVADADLLARWVVHHDEVAFELLVRRHAPTVRAACRRLLADAHDADDAAQAVFLVLARKAASVARGEVLAAWLHRVAFRAALRVRADRARWPTTTGTEVIEQRAAPPAPDPAWVELLSALDEEIERLPARHRTVFILCCLEGKTGEEVGRVLGCPPGTVSSRLTRARERLRDRLTQRGFAPAAVLAAVSGTAHTATASDTVIEYVLRAVSPHSTARTSGAAPDRPTAIAQGVVRAMFVQKVRFVPALLVAALLVTGAVFAGSGRDEEELPRPAPRGAAVDKEQPKPPGGLVVRFRVVQPRPGGVVVVWPHRIVAEASRQVQLLPGSAGVLKRVEADLGDRVKAGQLLAEIDAPELALEERLARVGVEQATGAVKEAQARIAIAKAEVMAAKSAVRVRAVEAAGAKALVDARKKPYESRLQSFKMGTASQSDVSDFEGPYLTAQTQALAAEVAIENAKGELLVKEAKLVQAEAGIATAAAQVEAAKVGLEKAQLALARARITAPFDGVITARRVQAGDFVRPGDRADPTPLFTVLQPDVLKCVVPIPEALISRVAVGQTAEIAIDAFPNRKMTGKVARLGVAVEGVDQAVRIEIDLPNPKGEIRPGMTGGVTLKLDRVPDGVLRVPVGAVIKVPGAKDGEPATAVYVYKDGKARLARVLVGAADRTEIEVVGGLGAGDLVVTDPKDLAPRAEVPVEIEKPIPPK
jgi:RND family efflux transporter MFP subunit